MLQSEKIYWCHFVRQAHSKDLTGEIASSFIVKTTIFANILKIWLIPIGRKPGFVFREISRQAGSTS